ncbi:MAG: hypothetical protein M1834_002665 [Cirrosporium novae-zelandiae]|nr:MAG: hypothetical protein M1834_002665 [Cirrosporium novae-zelandiae]
MEFPNNHHHSFQTSAVEDSSQESRIKRSSSSSPSVNCVLGLSQPYLESGDSKAESSHRSLLAPTMGSPSSHANPSSGELSVSFSFQGRINLGFNNGVVTTQSFEDTVPRIRSAEAEAPTPTSTSDACPSTPEASVGVRTKRRGHTKSRLGCFNCKIRKVKCQETRPSCQNCLKRGYTCEYPKIIQPQSRQLQTVRNNTIPDPRPVVQLSSTPSLFTLTDMRLLHHFILEAYPHLPVGQDAVWVHEVPAFAQHYEYLMHAILALSASHLTMTSNSNLTIAAINHRQLALEGLNKAISTYSVTPNDADAMLATCYALTFQSSYLGDALTDFLTLIRGCGLVSRLIAVNHLDTAFTIDRQAHKNYMKPREGKFPKFNPDLADAALNSVIQFKSLLGHPVEYSFYTGLLAVVSTLKYSSYKAYIHFSECYDTLAAMTQLDIEHLTNPSNKISQIILCHFVAIQIVVTPITSFEFSRRRSLTRTPIMGVVAQAENIERGLSKELRRFVRWPMSIMTTVKEEVQRQGEPMVKEGLRGMVIRKGRDRDRDGRGRVENRAEDY